MSFEIKPVLGNIKGAAFIILQFKTAGNSAMENTKFQKKHGRKGREHWKKKRKEK